MAGVNPFTTEKCIAHYFQVVCLRNCGCSSKRVKSRLGMKYNNKIEKKQARVHTYPTQGTVPQLALVSKPCTQIVFSFVVTSAKKHFLTYSRPAGSLVLQSVTSSSGFFTHQSAVPRDVYDTVPVLTKSACTLVTFGLPTLPPYERFALASVG